LYSTGAIGDRRSVQIRGFLKAEMRKAVVPKTEPGGSVLEKKI